MAVGATPTMLVAGAGVMNRFVTDSPVVHLGRVFSFSLRATNECLRGWERHARRIPCPALRREALDSLQRKRFHCQGGTVLAVAAPRPLQGPLVEFIVALQTISDYLDNLCDRDTARRERPPAMLEEDFRTLHRAFLDALAPDHAAGQRAKPCSPPIAYYAKHPFGDDGGYLPRLVAAARAALAVLPGWPAVRPDAVRLGRMYCELQVLKHLPTGQRERRVQAWLRGIAWPQARTLAWWEQAAAAGSTLGIFALALEAARSRQPRVDVLRAYDPWLASFHILLDYLIDQHEDEAARELNFVAQYPTPAHATAGLVTLWRRCRQEIAALAEPGLHRLVLYGLTALYLSDPKAALPAAAGPARALLNEAGWVGRALRSVCRRVVPRGGCEARRQRPEPSASTDPARSSS